MIWLAIGACVWLLLSVAVAVVLGRTVAMREEKESPATGQVPISLDSRRRRESDAPAGVASLPAATRRHNRR